jgi:hypothetical protein
MIRYTARQLLVQAKQAFRRIQLQRPEGGAKLDYLFKGWDLVVMDNQAILQFVHYDVRRGLEILKRSHVIAL